MKEVNSVKLNFKIIYYLAIMISRFFDSHSEQSKQPNQAGHSALSVERVPVDLCVRAHLQSDWLFQRRPVELLQAVWIAYSPSWTLRRDSSSTFQSSHTSRWPSVMSFTGFQSSVALSTKSVSSCETALSVRRHLIYWNSASLSPPCWVVSIFDLLAEMAS